MTTLDLLIAGRERIRKGWVKGYYAIDASGKNTGAGSARAVAWCPYGAVFLDVEAVKALHAVMPKYDTLVRWADSPKRTHAEIIDLFDRAIERIRSNEQLGQNA